MVDWRDPELQAKLGVCSTHIVYVILGLYGWEYVRSSHVETTLFRRQLSFRWPLVPYILGRFSFLLAVILLAIQFSPFPAVSGCQYMNMSIMFTTNIAIGCSTTDLMIRTWIIWNTAYVLRILLVILSLGQWISLTLFVASARASTSNGICMVSFVNPAYASATVVYAMVYDLLLLIFTVFGLWRIPSSSTLWRTLIKQGVVFFALNLIANTILLVLNRLNLNPVIDAIFGMPAACICTLASSQAVRSLLRPSPNDDSASSSLVKEPTLTGRLTFPMFSSALVSGA